MDVLKHDEAPPAPVGRVTTPIAIKSPGPARKSPLNTPFSANDDKTERLQNRALKAAAQRRALLSDLEDTVVTGKSDGQAMSRERVMNLYQNCIKLAAENKINQRNTWDLNLIDHISEIVRVESEEDTQTNFLKASCTLEAGVKIYAYRVDSVHNETFKVLNGLNRSSNDAGTDGGDASETTLTDEAKDQHRKAGGNSTTLEPSFENISVKKFDTAFAVDPLFQQTSAQFDEGGAKGLLLHNLSVYNGCSIVFDSAEVMNYEDKAAGSGAETIDVTFAWEHFQRMISEVQAQHEISPSFPELAALLDDPRRNHQKEAATKEGDLDDPELLVCKEKAELAWGMDGGGFEDVIDDFEPVGGEDEPIQWEAEGFEGTSWRADDIDGSERGSSESDVTAEMSNIADWLVASMKQEDPGKSSSWKGPKHWRFVKAMDAEETKPASRQKQAKQQEFIDFFGRDLTNDPRFKPVADSKTISLPKRFGSTNSDITKSRVVNYNSFSLTQLFLRPWSTANRKKKQCRPIGGLHEGPGVDASGGNSCFDGDDNGYDGLGSDWGGDIASDAFGDIDQGFNGSNVINDLSDNLVAIPKKVEKIEVTYARQSKQVDVKILKETIWGQLQSEQRILEKETRKSQEPVRFQDLLHDFPADCKAAPIEDISVHLCFICLLHLANEHGMAIQGLESMDDLKVFIDGVPPS